MNVGQLLRDLRVWSDGVEVRAVDRDGRSVRLLKVVAKCALDDPHLAVAVDAYFELELDPKSVA